MVRRISTLPRWWQVRVLSPGGDSWVRVKAPTKKWATEEALLMVSRRLHLPMHKLSAFYWYSEPTL